MSDVLLPRRESRTSGEHPVAARPPWWSPRRSLAVRFLWLLLPLALVPISLYWFLADREESRSEREVVRILLDQATEHERAGLQSAADSRVRELELLTGRIEETLGAAAAETLAALERPARTLPSPKPLEKLPEGVVREQGDGASAALISRAGIGTPGAARDLAATEALEKPFLALLTGQPEIVTLFVITRSGILRAVPAGDIGRWVRESGFPLDFKAPTRHLNRLLEPGVRPDTVVWTDVYQDVYGGKGALVTALRLVRTPAGAGLGQVGADLALESFFSRGDKPGEGDQAEVLFPGKNLPPVVRPERGLTSEEIAALEDLVAREAVGLHKLTGHGEAHLVAVRRLSRLPWFYVRYTSLTSVRSQVEAQARTVFAADVGRRNRLRLTYLAAMLGLGTLVVAAFRRAVEPIRRVARVADALTAGEPPPDLGDLGRVDEVGRLVSAMRNLERRIRRRISTMESTHLLAQTASVMTSPEETFARLTRLVAEGIGAGKCWLALWEPETRSLVLTPPGHGVPDGALGGRRLGLSERSLAVESYRTGETNLVNDVLADPRLSLAAVEELGVSRNIAFAPLKTEAGVLGVLVVADKPGDLDADDRAALESFADQAALLLRNARLYDELQRSYERLRDAQRNRDYFLQNVNHELRTPLTAILGWSEILAEDRPDPETMQTAMAQIRRSAQFLLTLISDLLDLSRFEEGRTKLEPEESDLAVVVRDAVEPVSVMAEGKEISLEVVAPAAGESTVRLDPVRVRQVLWNLLHNAVKFTPRGGRIALEARAGEAGVEFVVRDTGVGVDPKDLPYIFERFRQGDGSATRAYRGMGIGLSLVKAFVELHGGTVAAESQPGRGTTFRVHLPKLPPPDEKTD
ncbi:MAG TPA: GAF domain-containing sensor histidine kinase [Thermoanaerobaculia bacterium]|nr:GAF domain-containing sensor histidine kinase [Thermoanaerobaculia bacterium]